MTPLSSRWIKSNRFYLVLFLMIGPSIGSISGMERETPMSSSGQGLLNQFCSVVLNPIKIQLNQASTALKEKIPHKMKKSSYWANSFINGIKTNTTFAAFATCAYPANFVNGKNAILLQSLFLAKNIICMRMFSNNQDSYYFYLGKSFPENIGFKKFLIDNGLFLNNIIAPYSLILLIAGLSYAGFKHILQCAQTRSIHSVIFSRLV